MFEPDWWITRSTNALYGKQVVKIRKTWTEGTALTTLYLPSPCTSIYKAATSRHKPYSLPKLTGNGN